MRDMTCIACPMGCRLRVSEGADGQITVENYGCKRGIAYGQQEYTNPVRTVTSSVRVQGGKRPLCAVKTKEPIPKTKIPEVLDIIQAACPAAPLAIGQVVASNIAGTGVDLVATAVCEAK